jgi:regulatory protein
MTEKRITALTVQKRNPNRVNVYLDGEFAFGLSRIVAAWLENGRTLTQLEIDDLMRKDTSEVAFQKAIKLLDYRPRTGQEIRRKLHQKGFEPGQIEQVMERLESAHLIQDEKFAASWVESRNQFRPRSKRVLQYELRSKGIDEGLIAKALEGSVEDLELATRAAAKMVRRLASLDWQEFKKKLSAFLARRGFSYDTVTQVVKTSWDELQSEATILENEEFGK